MTMVPSPNLINQQQQFYGGCGDSYTESFGFMNRLVGYEYYCSNICLDSDLGIGLMAEEEYSRSSSLNEAGSSSKDPGQEDKDERWLQLGLGGYNTNNEQQAAEPTGRRSGLLELDLLPGGGSSQQHGKPLVPSFNLTEFRAPRPAGTNIGSTSMANINTPMFLQHPRTSTLGFQQHEGVSSWGSYRPPLWNPGGASSSSIPLGLPYYHPRPFHHQNLGMAGPSNFGLRVIDAPRRAQSNIWFLLQASQNQAKEPFLPQIPKSYLRIKDVRMTVRVLMKYLVSKLRLNSESEIEIRCRGQELPPLLTLQHVRDTIWSNNVSRRDAAAAVTLLPDTSPTDHLMILHYGRIA